MKKVIYSFIFLLMGIGSIQAQTAKEWLDKVEVKYTGATSYYIKFDFTHTNQGKSQKQAGELFSLKNKYNLNIDKINQIYDGKRLITIAKDDKEITISDASNTDDFLTPTKILSTYKTDYQYALDKKQTIGGAVIQFIKLTPKQSNSHLKYCLLGVNTSDNQIYQYQEINKDGATTTITVKEYLENLIIHKSYFNFDANKYKPKGYVITQL